MMATLLLHDFSEILWRWSLLGCDFEPRREVALHGERFAARQRGMTPTIR